MSEPPAAVDLAAVLRDARTIAVVGCSDNPSRTSHRIARYLLDAGYEVVPVNPRHEQVLGRTSYPSLVDVPFTTQIDIVNVFRRSDHTADVVRDTRARVGETGERPTIWTQLGVSSPEAEARAQEADLPYVRNRCIMVEHAHLL